VECWPWWSLVCCCGPSLKFKSSSALNAQRSASEVLSLKAQIEELKIVQQLVADYQQLLYKTAKTDEKLNEITATAGGFTAFIDSVQSTVSNIPLPKTTYIHWGRQTCSRNATLVYPGLAAAGYTDTLCMPLTADYNRSRAAAATSPGGLILTALYKTDYSTVPSLLDQNMKNVGCAMCEVEGAQHHMMVPAKLTCPTGWTKQYYGWLMATIELPSARGSLSTGDYVCVDDLGEGVPFIGGLARMYPVETDGFVVWLQDPSLLFRELACVVCIK